MNITTYSKNRIVKSAEQWHVERDYFQPLYNYLVYGWEPGGFWTAVLMNDWFGAIVRSHPGNNVEALKKTSQWIQSTWPKNIYGDYSSVKSWLQCSADKRRSTLEAAGLIYTEREEVEMALRGEHVYERELY